MEINSGTVFEKRRQQIAYRDSRDTDTSVDDSCLNKDGHDYLLVHSFLQLLLLKQQDS